MKPAEAGKVKILKMNRHGANPKIVILTVINESKWEITGFDAKAVKRDEKGNESEPISQYVDLEEEDRLGRRGLAPGKTIEIEIALDSAPAKDDSFRIYLENVRGFRPAISSKEKKDE